MLFAAGLVGLFKRRGFRCPATVHVDGAVHDHSPIIPLAHGTRQERKDRIKTATTAARGRPLGDSMRTPSFPYLQGRLPRIPLPRNPVNKAKKEEGPETIS